MLRRPPHRSDDGVAPASCHRVGNPLPERAVGPTLEFLELVAVIGDIAEETRSGRGRARSSSLFGRAEKGPQKSPVETSVMSGKV